MLHPTLSLFPKFLPDQSPDAVAAVVREVGLDTVNVVVRDGFPVSNANFVQELPRYVARLREQGLAVHYCTWGVMPEEAATSDGQDRLRALADSGITDFRMGYFQIKEGNPGKSLDAARRGLATMAEAAGRHGLRAIYQVHHHTLVVAPSTAYHLVNDLDPAHLGVMIDPGNQAYEGHERPELTIGLLDRHIAAVGIKDTATSRDPGKAGEERKGWTRTWVGIDQGEARWHDLFRGLKRIDFDGTCVFMPFYHSNDPEQHVATLKREVAYLRSVLEMVNAEA